MAAGAAVVLLITALPSVASAQASWEDKSQSGMAIGVGNSMAGTTGVLVHRYFTPEWGVQALLGINSFSISAKSPTATDVKRSVSTITIGGYALKQMRRWDRGTLNGMAGIEIALRSVNAENTFSDYNASAPDITLGAGFLVDLFLSDSVALVMQTGVRYQIVGEATMRTVFGGGSSDLSGSNLAIGPASSLGGTLSIMWWK